MSSAYFNIKINEELPLKKTEKGLFLFLYRATRIPPHLGIILNGKVYEITLIGANAGSDADAFLTTILKKYTKTIFLKLKLPEKINESTLEKLLTSEIKKAKKVTKNTSCIVPIKLFFKEIYPLDISHVNFIFDLIPILIQHNLIENTYHLNLERNISNTIFKLKTYAHEDIKNCLEALNRKEVIC